MFNLESLIFVVRIILLPVSRQYVHICTWGCTLGHAVQIGSGPYPVWMGINKLIYKLKIYSVQLYVFIYFNNCHQSVIHVNIVHPNTLSALQLSITL